MSSPEEFAKIFAEERAAKRREEEEKAAKAGDKIDDDTSSQTIAGGKVVVNIGITELPTKIEAQTNPLITGISYDGESRN